MRTDLRSTGSRRLPVLDGLRGIAAILVSLRHTIAFYRPVEFQESYLAVDLFFLLSGVVLAISYDERLNTGMTGFVFAQLRLIRIYPLYIFVSVISCFALLCAGRDSTWALIELLGLAIFMVPNLLPWGDAPFPLVAPAWSVFFELIANFAYAGFHRFLTTRILALIVLASGLALVASTVLTGQIDLDLGWARRSLAFGLPRVSFSFFAGVLIHRAYSALGGAKPVLRSNLATLMIFAMVTFILTSAPGGRFNLVFDLAMTLVVFPALIFLSIPIVPSGPVEAFCKFGGAFSYPLYLIHQPMGDIVQTLLQRLFSVSVGSYAPLIGLPLLIGLLALSWALDRYFDVPIRKYLTAHLPFSVKAPTKPAASPVID